VRWIGALVRLGVFMLLDGHRPSCGGSAQVEDGHAGEVDRGGQQPEVGIDAGRAADSGSAPAVASAHEVAELALDLGAGAAVGSDPGGVCLAGSGVGEGLLVAGRR
jgi:hypothetical protein